MSAGREAFMMQQSSLAQQSGTRPGRRQDRWVAAALTFTLGYGLLRLYWATGGRWAYTACARSTDRHDIASGCGAARLQTLPFWQGFGAVGLCVLVAVVVALSRRRAGRIAATAACVALVALSFPLHLLFEIPAGLAGRPTDWRDLGNRVLLLAGAALLAAAVAATRPEQPRKTVASGPKPAPLSLRRWACAAVVIPVLGWTVPHGLWALGVPFGIAADTLTEARNDLSSSTGVALAVVPGLASLLALGLAQRWGQVFPRWVPFRAGCPVPRLLALIPAAVVAVALIFYGLLGGAIMIAALVNGTLSRADLFEGWAVAATLLVFLGWGICLGMAAWGYHRLTRQA
jgi:hypothetical protein